MKFTRRSRIVAALLALVGVLYMQLALAAYVCPQVAKAPAPAMAKMAAAASCADMAIDQDQPTLCAGQDYAAANSLDKPAPPNVMPFIPASFVGAVVAMPPPSVYDAAVARLEPPPASPPVSLLHCCFRL